MSGWIKLRKTLITDDIRVQRVARKLGVHRLQVVGMLARLWILADDQFGGGDGDGVLRESADEIDEIVECPGFCAALPPDWLVLRADGLIQLPNYLEHNGSTAKRRAVEQRKKRRQRAAKERQERAKKKTASGQHRDKIGTASGQDRDSIGTRGEERREEEKRTGSRASALLPSARPVAAEERASEDTKEENATEAAEPSARGIGLGMPDANFERFWQAYPNPVGKLAAMSAWRSLGDPAPILPEILAGVVGWQNSGRWDSVRFVPHPARFLAERLWETVPPAEASQPAQPVKKESAVRQAARRIEEESAREAAKNGL